MKTRFRRRRARALLVAGLAISTLGGVAAGAAVPSAAPGGRVDTAKPRFSNPTNITNPLFPVRRVTSIVLLGQSDGERTKFEVTRLPGTKTITWDGQRIDAAISQFVAYNNGRIHEAALDYFAQADDGSVWYLGEDVSNYENGVVANTNGTWLAGRDGPGGMIMPAKPRVGDVFHSENIPGLVFEVDTVTAAGLTVNTPSGPVKGGIRIREVLMDGTREDKVYAPGYGQVTAVDLDASGSEALALAVPTDSRPGPVPRELRSLGDGAEEVFDEAPTGDWASLSATVSEMKAQWARYQARGVPQLLDAQMTEALQSLSESVDGHSPTEVRQASVEVAHAGLDLLLRHRPPADVDLGRMDAWAHQAVLDAGEPQGGVVEGDTATLEATWSRVRATVDSGEAARIGDQLRRLRAAADGKDYREAGRVAVALVEILQEV